MPESPLMKLRISDEAIFLSQLEQILNASAVYKLLAIRDRLESQEWIGAYLKGHYYPLSERYGGEVYQVCRESLEALGLAKARVEFMVCATTEVNAFSLYTFGDRQPNFVILNSGLLEKLELRELAFVVGHELGHLVFRHSVLQRVIDHIYPETDEMPAYLRVTLDLWRKLGEISADRIGLLTAGGIEPALEAMFKMAAGVSMSFFRLKSHDYLELSDEVLAGMPVSSGSDLETHPLSPLRVRALRAFHNSRTWNSLVKRRALTQDRKLEEEMEQLLGILRRQPRSPQEMAEYEFLLSAGALMLASDKEVSEDEYNYLVNLLSIYCYYPPVFIDEALRRIPADRQRLKRSAAFIVRHQSQRVRILLGWLISLMLRDNRIQDRELSVLVEIAQKYLKVPLPEVIDMVLESLAASYRPLS
jgi:Zn-dependent protease with chaperone function